MADARIAVAVIDASVAVRLVVEEVGTTESLAVFQRPLRWMAPRLMVVEVASALRQKCAAGVLSVAVAADALAATIDAVADGVIDLANDEMLAPSALTLALTLNHKVPDCVYLALAEREGALLASADRKLLALARSRGIEVAEIPFV